MWAIVTLVSLTLILTLVLCVPLEMTLQADLRGKPKFRLRWSWFFGLVSKDMAKKDKKPGDKGKMAGKKHISGKGKRRFGDMLEVLRTRGLPGQFKRLLKESLGSLKVRDLTADLRVGLGEPADTGLLFAFAGPAVFWFNSCTPHRIRVRPSLADEGELEGYSQGVIRLRPIRLVVPFLRFVFSIATARLVKKLVMKWIRKRK